MRGRCIYSSDGFYWNGRYDNRWEDTDCVRKHANCRFYTFNNLDSRWPRHMHLPITVWLTSIMRRMHACKHTHAAHAHSEKEIRTSIYAFYTPRSNKVCGVSSQEILSCMGVRSNAMKKFRRKKSKTSSGWSHCFIVQTFLARCLHPLMMLILT